jgi:hypothetical protein
MVDRKSQEGAAGEKGLFLHNGELAAASAVSKAAYPGIVHVRLLVLRPDFVVVADRLSAADGGSHTYDWLYHNLGETIAAEAATAEEGAPEGQGFEYLASVRRGTTDGVVRARIGAGADTTHVIVDGAGPSEVMVGTGVGESVDDRVPVLCVTRRGQNAAFAAVIESVPGGQEGRVESVRIEPSGTGTVVRVSLAGGAEEIYAWDDTGAARAVEGRTTSARLLALARANGGVRVLAEGGE